MEKTNDGLRATVKKVDATETGRSLEAPCLTARHTPTAGNVYRHFKADRGDDRLYEVVGLSRHTETNELLVNYRALYGPKAFRDAVWTRPLAMFLEPVDRKKYPEATARWRFTLCEGATADDVREGLVTFDLAKDAFAEDDWPLTDGWAVAQRTVVDVEAGEVVWGKRVKRSEG